MPDEELAMLTPMVGVWYMERDSSAVAGLCVTVLPSGTACVVAIKDPHTGKVTERVRRRSEIKGPMTALKRR